MLEGSSQSVKTEHSISHKIYIKRKELCPNHDLRYKYKCEYPDCQNRYICYKDDCIESHFHNQKTLTISKFNIQNFNSRFELAQKIVINEQKIWNQANFFRNTVEHLTTSIVELFKDMESYRDIFEELKNQKEKSILYDMADKCDTILSLQTKIKQKIDDLNTKVNLKEDDKNYFYYKVKNSLERYLKTQINKFSWDNCIQIWNSHKKSKVSEKFHERLQKKSNLLFLFIGEKRVIGSFYPDPYPDLQTKRIQSPKSFIFLNDEQKNEEFVTFKANPQSEHHLHISEKLMICHGNTPSWGDGVRTFARNFDYIEFYLPSNSYLSTSPSQEGSMKVYCGNLKLMSLKVMQVKIQQ